MDIYESFHTPAKEHIAKKEREKKHTLLFSSHLSVSYLHPPLQVKWNDLMCSPVRGGNAVGG